MSKYYIFGSILSFFMPTKNDSQKIRQFFKEIDQRKIINLVQNRYNSVLEKIKSKYKKEKIKVIFLNETPAKWQYQSLYEELNQNDDFEVQVLVTIMSDRGKLNNQDFMDSKNKAIDCYNFFKDNNMNVDFAYDFEKEAPIDLTVFNPDIIFYEQPWGIYKKHNIEETSKFALTCYSSYGSAITNGKNEYGSLFFKLLYKYFIDNEFAKYILISHSALPDSIVVSGHPKLDNYIRPLNKEQTYWKTKDKKRIIIAPHFSFYKEAGMHSGTFNRNYKFFIEYAKLHQEYEFIFKPHPRLKEDIVKQKLMTQEECENYYNEWNILPNAQLIERGNYIDMFRTSNLLITDCNSFLFEYLPTENPVIRVVNKDFIGHNPFGEKIINGYYSVRENNEIEYYIDKLLKEEKDQLKEYRQNLLKLGIQPKCGYAKFVVNHLIDCILERNNK